MARHATRGVGGVTRRLGAGALARALMLVACLAAVAGAAVPPFPVIGKAAPDFTLTDQTGTQIRLSQFRGKIVLMNFIYTHCVDVCPITTAALAQVQRELIQRGWWVKDFVFISVTTDPARDTPPVLSAYARKYHADFAGWHFLTGNLQTVQHVHRLYGIQVRPAEKGLQEHYLPTFVMNRSGTVLGAYGVNPDPHDVLSDLEGLR